MNTMNDAYTLQCCGLNAFSKCMQNVTVCMVFSYGNLEVETHGKVSPKGTLTKYERCHVNKHIESSKKESEHDEAGVIW